MNALFRSAFMGRERGNMPLPTSAHVEVTAPALILTPMVTISINTTLSSTLATTLATCSNSAKSPPPKTGS